MKIIQLFHVKQLERKQLGHEANIIKIIDIIDIILKTIIFITFRIKIYFDIALSYTNLLLNYMRIQALYALTGIGDIYILLNR